MRRYGLSSRKFTSASCFARLSRTPPSPKDAQLAASDPERDPRPSPRQHYAPGPARPATYAAASSFQPPSPTPGSRPLPGGTPRPPAGPLPPRCPLSPPGRGRARPGRRAGAGPRAAPAPPGNPPSPAAG